MADDTTNGQSSNEPNERAARASFINITSSSRRWILGKYRVSAARTPAAMLMITHMTRSSKILCYYHATSITTTIERTQ